MMMMMMMIKGFTAARTRWGHGNFLSYSVYQEIPKMPFKQILWHSYPIAPIRYTVV